MDTSKNRASGGCGRMYLHTYSLHGDKKSVHRNYLSSLKGQSLEICEIRFFYQRAPPGPIRERCPRAVSIFYDFSRRHSVLKKRAKNSREIAP